MVICKSDFIENFTNIQSDVYKQASIKSLIFAFIFKILLDGFDYPNFLIFKYQFASSRNYKVNYN